jgi:uncharacterized protein (UPF0332 family)/predicted nucleotidyltransferase
LGLLERGSAGIKEVFIMQLRTTRKEYIAEPGEVEHIVKRFSEDIHKELGELVKSVVWFGSGVKGGFATGNVSLRDEILFGSDIDVLIIFDDLVHALSPEVVTAYRVITEKTAARISKRMHITTMPLTKFWDYCLKGDPILINMLRDGNPMYDAGCFGMAKGMLASDKILPESEIVQVYLARGPMSVANAEWNMKQAVIDLHWAVMDAVHSALLHYSIVPESPSAVVELMKYHLVEKGIMHKRYLSVVGEFMNVGRMLMSGEVHKVSGDHYDRYRKEAEDFLHVVKAIVEK